MATLSINTQSIARYFGFLKNMDRSSKKKLIRALTDSMAAQTEIKTGVDHLFGAWEDTRSAEEIIHEIRTSRTQNPQIDLFE